MDSLVDLSWRAHPAGAIVALGGLGVAMGALEALRSARLPFSDRTKQIAWVSGLRLAIVGLAVVGLGSAWISQQLWVLLLALAISGEELLETSVVLYALRRGRRLEAELAARRASA